MNESVETVEAKQNKIEALSRKIIELKEHISISARAVEDFVENLVGASPPEVADNSDRQSGTLAEIHYDLDVCFLKSNDIRDAMGRLQ